jgi:hypothetical protein
MVDVFQFSSFEQEAYAVRCMVYYVGERKRFDENTTQRLLDWIRKMGKWESLAQTIRDLNITTDMKLPSNFGYERYRVTHMIENDGIFVGLRFALTSDEALRRTQGKSDLHRLELDEITMQIANLPKWQNVENMLREIRPNRQS